MDLSRFNAEYFEAKAPEVFRLARRCRTLEDFRKKLAWLCHNLEHQTFDEYEAFSSASIVRVRDCAEAISRMLTRRSEDESGFSVAKAIRDVATGKSRSDLSPAFYADVLHLFLGLQGRGPGSSLSDAFLMTSRKTGRDAARERSRHLDDLWAEVNLRLNRIPCGLTDDARERRAGRRRRILQALGGGEADWNDWQWQVRHLARTGDAIESHTPLTDEEREAIRRAGALGLPFGVTPHYLSLMDDDPAAGRDRAVRAQVLPPLSYVEHIQTTGRSTGCLDFMRESDTSPVDLITRRYPAICIFKPFNTCPQICVYCQRNWEIDDAMAPGALAPSDKIEAALRWIQRHPVIHEVLITGGDPLAMDDENLEWILRAVAAIPSVERIRIGSRVPVTLPMRITEELAGLLGSLREPGRRQVSLVTHVQHAYELTHDTVTAVERLRSQGIPVFNQLVYTFHVSRRFEAAFLRRQLALIGIEPYYTFCAKGKHETAAYRVPIARLLQEQFEESRLMPGLTRTDEAVFNVPGLGKNYLRARQRRDLISILPNGSRLYEFHPWDRHVSREVKNYVGEDVPILEYLQQLERIGEDVADYQTLWYYI